VDKCCVEDDYNNTDTTSKLRLTRYHFKLRSSCHEACSHHELHELLRLIDDTIVLHKCNRAARLYDKFFSYCTCIAIMWSSLQFCGNRTEACAVLQGSHCNLQLTARTIISCRPIALVPTPPHHWRSSFICRLQKLWSTVRRRMRCHEPCNSTLAVERHDFSPWENFILVRIFFQKYKNWDSKFPILKKFRDKID